MFNFRYVDGQHAKDRLFASSWQVSSEYEDNQHSVVARLCCRFFKFNATRAQFLWLINAFCLIIHGFMCYLCLTVCSDTPFGVRATTNQTCTKTTMLVPIFRLSGAWNSSAADGYVVTTKANDMPVRFDLLVASFFGISAVFHGFVVLVGPFEGLSWLYWAQLDNCWCWWRWAEYSISAPIMFFALQLIIGLRDENTLSFSFLLVVFVMAFGFATESWSRPSQREQDGNRGWVGDPQRTDEVVCADTKKNDGEKLSPTDVAILRSYSVLYRQNYYRRMIFHVLGWIPYTFVWFVYFRHFIRSLDDLRLIDVDLWDSVPDFVPYAISATFVFFTLFAFVQIRYQYGKPDDYWKTEVWYVFLSLISKLSLGILLYVNVLMFSSFDAALDVS